MLCPAVVGKKNDALGVIVTGDARGVTFTSFDDTRGRSAGVETRETGCHAAAVIRGADARAFAAIATVVP